MRSYIHSWPTILSAVEMTTALAMAGLLGISTEGAMAGGYPGTENETAPTHRTGVTFEATAGVITPPFVITNGSLYQPLTTPAPTNGGRATYSFNIDQPGDYVVRALVNASNETGNSCLVNLDAEPADSGMVWDIPLTGGYEECLVCWRAREKGQPFAHKIFHLASGAHQLIVRGRDANTQFRRFELIRVPGPPQNLRVVPTTASNLPR